MMCPHCGVATAYQPVYHSKMVQFNGDGDWRMAYLDTGSIYDRESSRFFGLSRCADCGRAFPVRGESKTTEEPDRTAYQGSIEPLWPVKFRGVPSELPPTVREAMEDASAALAAKSKIGSMLAARTALIRAQRHMKAKLGLEEASLKALLEAGLISQYEFESSDVARRWANYLGHEDPDPDKSVTLADAQELYEYVEGLLETLYVKRAKLESHRARLRGEETSTS